MAEAGEELQKALDLAPISFCDRLSYGLALLRVEADDAPDVLSPCYRRRLRAVEEPASRAARVDGEKNVVSDRPSIAL